LVLYGSEDFIKEFETRVNANRAYEEAAKDWEGDFLFITDPEGPLTHEVVYYVDLYHGKCRSAKLLGSRDEVKTRFIYEGPLSSWVKLLSKELDPIGSLMLGKFRLHGNLITILKYTRAAKELVNSVASVPTDYPPDWSAFIDGIRSGKR
jgi:putative sterol carrier protein